MREKTRGSKFTYTSHPKIGTPKHNLQTSTSNGSTFIIKDPQVLAFNSPGTKDELSEIFEQPPGRDRNHEGVNQERYDNFRSSLDLKKLLNPNNQKFSLKSIKSFTKSPLNKSTYHSSSYHKLNANVKANNSLDSKSKEEVKLYQPNSQNVNQAQIR